MFSFTWSEIAPTWVSWEFLGFITGVLSVLLLIPTKLVRLQWTNWIFSIISSAVYLFLFREWHLYGNAVLQPIFLVLSIWGGWYWRGQLRGIVDSAKEIPITFARRHVWISALGLAFIGLIPVMPVLRHWGDVSPLWDGLILTVSLAALWLQLKKYVQNWYLWILVDVIAVPFHHAHGRDATAVLYLSYGIMCLIGLVKWLRSANGGTNSESVSFVESSYTGVG